VLLAARLSRTCSVTVICRNVAPDGAELAGGIRLHPPGEGVNVGTVVLSDFVPPIV
jgi:hypothetical protein